MVLLCPLDRIKTLLDTGRNYRDMGSDRQTDEETLFCNIVFLLYVFVLQLGFVVFVCFTRFPCFGPDRANTVTSTTYKEPSCLDPVVVRNTQLFLLSSTVCMSWCWTGQPQCPSGTLWSSWPDGYCLLQLAIYKLITCYIALCRDPSTHHLEG